jgi:hypothetical protein
MADRTQRRIDALMRASAFKVRLKAARDLGRSGKARAIAPLVIASEDPHPLVRASVAHALGGFDTPRATAALCQLRGDRDAFVQKTARARLAARGGAGRCTTSKTRVHIKLSGGDPALQAAVMQVLRRKAERAVRLELTENDADGIELLVRLTGHHRHHAGGTDIRCQTTQSVVALPSRALRAPSWTLNADMKVSGAPLSEQEIPGQMRACLDHLAPKVFEGLVAYVSRAR